MGSRLTFNRVEKDYNGRRVVNGITLAIEGGAIVALAGVNGSGKSTLFRVAAGFVRPSSGFVSMEQSDPSEELVLGHAPAERVRLGLAYIPQDRGILRGLSTMKNLRMARGFAATPMPLESTIA
jgi:ABC-type branched-subunit amino acid transport system ATPase component